MRTDAGPVPPLGLGLIVALLMGVVALPAMATQPDPAQPDPAAAEVPYDPATAFVINNVIGIFYHELGHALIDVLALPVLGQEEDAADILSVLLIDALWQEDAAQAMAADVALSYLISADAGEEPAWWDVHGADLQRHYSMVCLFYGANPAERQNFVEAFELPADRAEGCPDEFDLASASWGGYLDQIAQTGNRETLRLVGDAAPEDMADVGTALIEELDDLNARYALPRIVDVELVACDEANAFYDPARRTITICTEFVTYLRDQAVAAEL
jgi:hypothetical protein